MFLALLLLLILAVSADLKIALLSSANPTLSEAAQLALSHARTRNGSLVSELQSLSVLGTISFINVSSPDAASLNGTMVVGPLSAALQPLVGAGRTSFFQIVPEIWPSTYVDQSIYPHLVRLAGDLRQLAQAVVDTILFHGWKHVGILYSGEDVALGFVGELTQQSSTSGVEFSRQPYTNATLRQDIRAINTLTVFLLVATTHDQVDRVTGEARGARLATPQHAWLVVPVGGGVDLDRIFVPALQGGRVFRPVCITEESKWARVMRQDFGTTAAMYLSALVYDATVVALIAENGSHSTRSIAFDGVSGRVDTSAGGSSPCFGVYALDGAGGESLVAKAVGANRSVVAVSSSGEKGLGPWGGQSLVVPKDIQLCPAGLFFDAEYLTCVVHLAVINVFTLTSIVMSAFTLQNVLGPTIAALDIIARNGTIIPQIANISVPFRMKVFDSHFTEIGAAAALERARAWGITCIVGTALTAETTAVALPAAAMNIPLMSASSSAPSLADKTVYPYFSRTAPSLVSSAASIIDYCVYFKWKRFALMYQDDVAGTDLARELLASAAKYNITIDLVQRAGISRGSMESALQTIKRQRNRVIVFATGLTAVNGAYEFEAIVWRASELGLIRKGYAWLAPSTFINALFFTFTNATRTIPLVLGFKRVSAAFPVTAPYVNFQKRFTATQDRAKFKPFSEVGHFWLNDYVMAQDPTFALGMGEYGLYAYDATVATMLACDTLYKANKSINGSSFMAQIQNISFVGATGPISFQANGDKPANSFSTALYSTIASYPYFSPSYISASGRIQSVTATPMTWIEGDTRVPHDGFCDTGYNFDELNLVCVIPPCGPGEYRISTISCVPCPAGTALNSTSGLCDDCPPGTFSSSPGQSQCAACSPGTFQSRSRQILCESCGVLGFSPLSGTSACTECPAHSSTCDVSGNCALQSNSIDACLCEAGYYGDPSSGVPCTDCPAGGDCCRCASVNQCVSTEVSVYHVNTTRGVSGSGGNTSDCSMGSLLQNLADLGHMCTYCDTGLKRAVAAAGQFEVNRLSEFGSGSMPDSPVFVPCVPTVACLGGPTSQCAEGYAGDRCGFCESSFYRNPDNECLKCPEATAIRTTLTIAALLIPLVLGAFFVNNASNLFRASAITILLDCAQMLSVISSFDVAWPSIAVNILNVFNATNFSVNILPLSCIFSGSGWSFFNTWLLQMTLPAILVGASIAVFLLFNVLQRFHLFSEKDWSLDTLISTMCICCTVCYTIVTKNSFEIFRCVQPKGAPGNSVSFLVAAPGVACGSAIWRRYLPAAISFAIIYGAGVPLVFLIVLWRLGETGRMTAKNRHRYGSICGIYRDGAWYWNSILMFRKLLVIVCMSLFPSETLMQICLATVFIFLSFVLNTVLVPFRFPPANDVQFWCGMACVICVICSVIFYFRSFKESRVTDTHTTATVVLLWGVCIFAMVFAVRGWVLELLSYVTWNSQNRAQLKRVVTFLSKYRFGRYLLAKGKRMHWATILEHRQMFSHHLTAREKRLVFPLHAESHVQRHIVEETLHQITSDYLLTDLIVPRYLPNTKLYLLAHPEEGEALIEALKKFALFHQDSAIAQVYSPQYDEEVVHEGGPKAPIQRRVSRRASFFQDTALALSGLRRASRRQSAESTPQLMTIHRQSSFLKDEESVAVALNIASLIVDIPPLPDSAYDGDMIVAVPQRKSTVELLESPQDTELAWSPWIIDPPVSDLTYV